MALRCASVIRGGKKPLVVELTSNCADAFGVVVPIPVWANNDVEIKREKIVVERNFIILALMTLN